MNFRANLGSVAAFVLAGLAPRLGAQQEHPVQRVANIVSVAVEEYKKGVDSSGRMVSADEYQEAVDFMRDARDAASRLSGARAIAARAILDTIATAMAARRPASELDPLGKRFAAALGSEAALELPTKPIDVAEGAKLYQANCASCHGVHGLGDGPVAATLNP